MTEPIARVLFVETSEGHGAALEAYMEGLTKGAIDFQTVSRADGLRERAADTWDAVLLDIDPANGRKEDLVSKIKLFFGQVPIIDLADGPAETATSNAVLTLESYFTKVPVSTLALLRGINHVLERRRLSEEVGKLKERLAGVERTDPVTGLWTHAYTMERISESFGDWKRYKTPMSLCLIRLLNLDRINEAYGDEVVIHVIGNFGRIIKSAKRSNDYASRLDQDLFCLAFPATGLEAAMICVERLRDALGATVFTGKSAENFTVGANFGIVQLDDRFPRIEALFDAARGVLEKARAAGLNQIATG